MLQAGVHYPGNFSAMRSSFSDDAARKLDTAALRLMRVLGLGCQ
jgi:hypothetical protein